MLRSALALCLLPSLAFAQDLTLDADAIYERYDQDGNKTLSQEEFDRMYQEEVVQTAKALGPAEVQQQAMPLPSPEVSFRELDVNGDGGVSMEELRANAELTAILGRDEQAPRG